MSSPTPNLTFPSDLPVSQRVDEIANAIREHQVVIVVGDTGSGKTTQLPKLCLAMGLGSKGLIGHTQPRRLAARSVAARIAEETQTELGDLVGYKVRFQDQVSKGTRIKLLTDGMLLAETRGDKFLKQYDTLIIDEAHERGLNIDFLLGYIKRLITKRRDLKVIITSATINYERFSEHFNNAPVVQVEGRTFPVEVRYRPIENTDDDIPMYRAIVSGVEELRSVDREQNKRHGDVLVFLSGEREIRGAAEALRRSNLANLDVLPLYARLSASEQQRIFHPSGGPQRVVLATNVAETSLTVPGIRYVIDTGLARMSRYSYRSKVQRLPIEAISQASANQRKGRCGRLEPGICIRLYSQEDFEGRRAFTEPELQRTNLASVILQMLDLKLGDITKFPFIDPPDRRYVTDGYRLLEDIDAIDDRRILTELGRELARLPIDPKLGRIVLAGREHHCVAEMLSIASFLSVQDPRERPRQAQEAADLAHGQDAHEQSDFLTIHGLWERIETQRQALGSSAFKRWCQKHFLHHLRVREWREIHRQLWLALKSTARMNTEPADYRSVHQALLTGFIGSVGLRDEQDYRGCRDTRFQLHPGRQSKGRPKWVLAAELTETSRLFARTVAKIEPEWVETVARKLVKYTHGDPYWSKRQGQIMVHERGTLFGLPVVGKRAVGVAKRLPGKARELLIRDGLCQGEIKTQGPFLQNNLDQVAKVLDLEARERRRDLLDDHRLFEFYDQRVPQDVIDARSFERWRRRIERDHPQFLYMVQADVLRRDSELDLGAYPDHLSVSGNQFPLTYEFNPGSTHDGVSVEVPQAALHVLTPGVVDWLVPGLLIEKVEALLRTLPKVIRRQLVPLPDFSKSAGQDLRWREGDLIEQLGRAITRRLGAPFDISQFDLENLDTYYRMNIRVMDPNGQIIAQGRDLLSLQRDLKVEADLSEPVAEAPVHKAWSVGDLPSREILDRDGLALSLIPVIAPVDGGVQLRHLDDPAEAQAVHRQGVLKLARDRLATQARLLRQSKWAKELNLLAAPRKLNPEASEQWISVSIERACFSDGIPRDQAGFDAGIQQGRSQVVELAEAQANDLLAVLKAAQSVGKRLKGAPLAWAPIAKDIQGQLTALLSERFIEQTPHSNLLRLPVYLQAIEARLERAGGRFDFDATARRELEGFVQALMPYWPEYPNPPTHAEAAQVRWLLEEYRISLFAQHLGTHGKVSNKRINQLLSDLRTQRAAR